MRPLRLLTTLIACALLLAIPATEARANAADDRILTDCQESPTGALRGSYPLQQLNHALHNIPGDQLEYSGCYDAIKQARLAALTGGKGGGGGDAGSGTGAAGGGASSAGVGGGTSGGGGSATGAVPEAAPPPGADAPLDVAGSPVVPGALPEIGHGSHRLPTSLLVLLVLVGVAALVPAALTIGRRVVDHRRA